MVGDQGGPPPLFVADAHGVRPALAALDAPVLGVDVERADADRYFRRAALVQVGSPAGCVLLDTVALDRLPDLDRLLDADHLAVLHAVENDLEPLAALGVAADHLADTAVAAAVLGLPTGLSSLLEQVLDIQLTADKEALQRANWEQRPLTPEMEAYAAGDVVHLPALWEALAGRLEEAARRSWYEQELQATVERSAQAERDWTRVKGAGRLDPRQRAVLRALWEAREAEAREHDIAPNLLVHDEVLLDLAQDPPRTEPQLVRRSRRRRNLLRNHAGPLFAAVEAGLTAPEEPKPASSRWSEVERAVHDALRVRRAEIAREVGLEPGVLCPAKVLLPAVAGTPADAGELSTLAGFRPWQRDLLEQPLWEAYTEAARARSA